MAAFRLLVCCALLFFPHLSHSIPEPGKLTMTFDKDFEYRGFSKALYKDATISAKGKCITSNKDSIITIQWKLKYTQCADYFLIQKDLINLWDSNRQYELTGTDRLKCKSPMSLNDHSKQQEHIEPPTTSQKLNSTAKTLESKLSTINIAAKKRQDTSKKEGNNAEDHDSGSTKTNKILTRKGHVKKKSGGIKGQSVKKKSGGIKGQTQGHTSRIRRAVGNGSEDEQETKEEENEGSNSKLLNVLAENEVGKPPPKKSKRKQSNSQTKKQQKEETTATAITTENILATDHQVDSDPSKKKQGTNRIATTRRDGIYMLIVTVVSEDGFQSLELEVAMESKSGFLSATDWPLLPFYGVMSLVYLFYGLVWLIVSACQWRDLLRIQFWIGGVIALGMLEKAVFYSEYNNINHTGIPTPSLVVFAEVVSVAKRTLARMLVIIVSMGFGIVKPRLGKSLHRVLGVGALYFVLAIVEGSMRSLSLKADPSKEQLVAGIPLAVLDAAICWWIFMSLVQTTRTLRIRRNVVKLSLYRHFTNTLIFAVLASVAYMIWSIKTHRFAECLKDWSELWLDEAFWHFLFSIILLVIMVLWRPTANNQRYAFTPIVDFDDDDEQDNVTLSEAFDGMKMRNTRTEVVVNGGDAKKKAEDDLKWVEEHIPSSAADTVLPSVLDSDEELMTTKFEMSKMD